MRLPEPGCPSHAVIGTSIEVHRRLGPGLLESAYEACLAHELTKRRIPFERQRRLPVRYDGIELPAAYRLDLDVDRRVIVEIKAVQEVLPVHLAQLMTYLKLTRRPVGLLLNFNEPRLIDGLHRRVL